MPRYVYVNGRYERYESAQIHVEDRGYQFADGVYEVIACINGQLADERGHLDRLARSLSELDIPMPVSRPALQHIMREILHRNRLHQASIYIQVTRGVAARDFVFPARDKAKAGPSLVVMARPFHFDDTAKLERGIAVITAPDQRWARRDIKTIALLPQVLAKQKAAGQGAAEAWMLDPDGYVTEGASSNAWIITQKGKLVTRHADQGILRGVTRTALEELCRQKNLEIEERPFTPAEAYAAQEAFNSSAVALITPVTAIDGHKIGSGQPGPVTGMLYQLYLDYVSGHCGPQREWTAS